MKDPSWDAGRGCDQPPGEFRSEIEQLARYYVAPEQRLAIKVMDAEHAGDFAPCRGTRFNNSRILGEFYAPRLESANFV